MNHNCYTELSKEEQALVAIAVLLDGQEAAAYLKFDHGRGAELSKAADYLSGLKLELRMPYVGTVLRSALD